MNTITRYINYAKRKASFKHKPQFVQIRIQCSWGFVILPSPIYILAITLFSKAAKLFENLNLIMFPKLQFI
jgi:hypothetical protein